MSSEPLTFIGSSALLNDEAKGTKRPWYAKRPRHLQKETPKPLNQGMYLKSE